MDHKRPRVKWKLDEVHGTRDGEVDPCEGSGDGTCMDSRTGRKRRMNECNVLNNPPRPKELPVPFAVFYMMEYSFSNSTVITKSFCLNVCDIRTVLKEVLHITMCFLSL